jgi:hypothetical protein
MTLNFAALRDNKTNFTPGQETKVFISNSYGRGSVVPQILVNLAPAGAGGTGATATVVVTPSEPGATTGSITAINISAGGSGYVAAQIAFTGAGGAGATADLIITNGIVSGYENLIGGYDYPVSGTTASITNIVNTTGDIAVGDIEIFLASALTVPLYEGTRIEFTVNGVSTPVYVSHYTPAGYTAIPIVPSLYAIPVGAGTLSGQPGVGTIFAWVPVFSVNQINLDNTATVIAEQNFSAGLDTQKAVTQLDGKSNAQGVQVYQDPGLAILQGANTLGKLVVVEVVKPFQRGVRRYEAIVAGLPENIQKNQFIMQSINLERSGALTSYEI